MKLIVGLAALAEAAVNIVDCNAGTDGAVAMSMEIDQADVQRTADMTAANWSLSNGKWSKTAYPADATITESGAGDAKQLVLTHIVDTAGCEKKNVDGVDVCVKAGHAVTFTCSYPMKNQELTEQAFKVSGSDTEKSATKTGTLTYNLSLTNVPMDNTSNPPTALAYSIGNTVEAQIKPVTENLVWATIESCSVKNKSKSQSVALIKDNMVRTCEVGADINTGMGKEALTFSWNSFKWNTAAVSPATKAADEEHHLSCTISLALAQPASETKNTCPSA